LLDFFFQAGQALVADAVTDLVVSEGRFADDPLAVGANRNHNPVLERRVLAIGVRRDEIPLEQDGLL
jgi:hypothetical protein